MTLEELLSFIEQLAFIKNRSVYAQNGDKTVVITSVDEESRIVNGKAIIRIAAGEEEIIEFSSNVSKTQDVLRIKSQYRINLNRAMPLPNKPYTEHMVITEGEPSQEEDAFAIISDEKEHFFRPRYKYLYHLVDRDIKAAYKVGRDYSFSEGFDEGFENLELEKTKPSKPKTFAWKRKGRRQV